jgi:DNA-binding NarL/FixJ family response regulator
MHLLLVDDHPLIHVALRALLADFDPPVQLHSALDAEGARTLLTQLRPSPDLLLLDLQLADAVPQSDGFALLDEMRARYPALPIVCLSGTNQMAEVIRAIDQGAMGFIPKHVDPEEFKAALALIVVGGIYVPPMRLDSAAPAPARPSEPRPAAALPASLAALPITPRLGQPHVDGREGLGLRHLEQALAAELEHGDEGHHQHRHAARGVEEVLELHEAPALQRAARCSCARAPTAARG